MNRTPRAALSALVVLLVCAPAAVAEPGDPDLTYGENGRAELQASSRHDRAEDALTIGNETLTVGWKELDIDPDPGVVERYDAGVLAKFTAGGDPGQFVGGPSNVSLLLPRQSRLLAGAMQGDKLITVGYVEDFDQANPPPVSDWLIARWDIENGSLDPTFGTPIGGEWPDGVVVDDFGSGEARALDVSIDGDGKIVVGGWVQNDGGARRVAVARYTEDGDPDTLGFGTGGRYFGAGAPTTQNAEARAVTIQPGDGKIVVGGQESTAQGSELRIDRLTTGGQLDPTWVDEDDASTPGVVRQETGGATELSGIEDLLVDETKVVAAGYGGPNGNEWVLYRFLSTGTLDAGSKHLAGGTPGGRARAVVKTGGRYIAAGAGADGDAEQDFMVAGYETENVGLDPTFGEGSAPGYTFLEYGKPSEAYGLTVLGDSVVAVGYAGAIGFDADNHAATKYAATDAGGPARPASTSPPTVTHTGELVVGTEFRVTDNGDWTGSPDSFLHRWLRCAANGTNCKYIGQGPDFASTDITDPFAAGLHQGTFYKSREADANRLIRVEVWASNAVGYGDEPGRAAGGLVTPLTPPDPPPGGPPPSDPPAHPPAGPGEPAIDRTSTFNTAPGVGQPVNTARTARLPNLRPDKPFCKRVGVDGFCSEAHAREAMLDAGLGNVNLVFEQLPTKSVPRKWEEEVEDGYILKQRWQDPLKPDETSPTEVTVPPVGVAASERPSLVLRVYTDALPPGRCSQRDAGALLERDWPGVSYAAKRNSAGKRTRRARYGALDALERMDCKYTVKFKKDATKTVPQITKIAFDPMVVTVSVPAVDELAIGLRDDPWHPQLPPSAVQAPSLALGTASRTVPVSRLAPVTFVAKVMDKATGTQWKGAKVKLWGPKAGGGFQLLDEATTKKGGDAVFQASFPRSGPARVEATAVGANGLTVEGTQSFVVSELGPSYRTESGRDMELKGGGWRPAPGGRRRAVAGAAQLSCDMFDMISQLAQGAALGGLAIQAATLARDPAQTKEVRDAFAAAVAVYFDQARNAGSLAAQLVRGMIEGTGFAPMTLNDGAARQSPCASAPPAAGGTVAGSTGSASVIFDLNKGIATLASFDMVLVNGGQVFSSQGTASDAVVVNIGGRSVLVPQNARVIASGGGNYKVVGPDGNVIASGGGNVIASGGGNVVIPDGAQVIASGGGNFRIEDAGGRVIASGGGNAIEAQNGAFVVKMGGATAVVPQGAGIIASGGGNFRMVQGDPGVIASGGGNVIASGGGNVIASGGGNLVIPDGANLIGQAGTNLIGQAGTNLIGQAGTNFVIRDGSRVIASGGGNVIASGGGNVINGSAEAGVIEIGRIGGFPNHVVVPGDARVIASGGGNVIASGGGNFDVVNGSGRVIASGGGNVIASGGGNVIASGGGNLILQEGWRVIASGGGNFNLMNAIGKVIASGGGNMIGTKGAQYLTMGAGNLAIDPSVIGQGNGNLLGG